MSQDESNGPPVERPKESGYPLCSPVPGESIADEGLLRRARGCWLGQLAGDALGSMVEFKFASEIADLYPDGLRTIAGSPVWGTIPGQPTDDSELALMLARTLVRDGGYDDERVAGAYLYWYESGPFDIGTTTSAALWAMQRAHVSNESLVDAARRRARHESQANGALMRQSPLAIWGNALPPDALASIARRDAALTHPHPVCQDASEAHVVALAAIIGGGLSASEAHAMAVRRAEVRSLSPEVIGALRRAESAPPPCDGDNMGWVLIALQNAWYEALHAPSLEEGLVATVGRGGDTDTNGAIAGALLGALHGASAIPSQWRGAILTCRPEKGRPNVRQPRPQALWPIDAEALAERLALAGQKAAQELGL